MLKFSPSNHKIRSGPMSIKCTPSLADLGIQLSTFQEALPSSSHFQLSSIFDFDQHTPLISCMNKPKLSPSPRSHLDLDLIQLGFRFRVISAANSILNPLRPNLGDKSKSCIPT